MIWNFIDFDDQAHYIDYNDNNKVQWSLVTSHFVSQCLLKYLSCINQLHTFEFDHDNEANKMLAKKSGWDAAYTLWDEINRISEWDQFDSLKKMDINVFEIVCPLLNYCHVMTDDAFV
jgi:hypothetical protein